MILKDLIREIPDFPVKGISFKDITTLLKDNLAIHSVIEELKNNFADKGITKVVGIEARGFIIGGALANELNAGFVPVRKKGKLPGKTISESYDLEYGTDSIEMHQDGLSKGDIVLIHDDLLATGGTAHAVLRMLNKAGISKIYFCFICDLEFIQSADKDIIYDYNPYILVKYSD
ncbi:MAG: adenine phosphoribosyltransferase [Prolixibacteraceae bacterium]|jgi:adenine phosphoribosyltransferase|nr:adenine phosphoribosyltransferase [Prolixibacteraceae bacterium]MDD4754924.1 adenine phosphoribosyltransferase [Prolixibacteraceae bacterium]NLO01356.1 adenine phosphoribosyltransferase [Bacteroidales bacterium]